MKFLAGFLTMLFIVSVLNCSGTGGKKNTGMVIIDHSSPAQTQTKQETVPCVDSDDF